MQRKEIFEKILETYQKLDISHSPTPVYFAKYATYLKSQKLTPTLKNKVTNSVQSKTKDKT